MMDEDMPVFVPRTDVSFPHSGDGLCRYNESGHYNNSVICMERINCDRCGWNPTVARQRSFKIRQKLREQDGKNED